MQAIQVDSADISVIIHGPVRENATGVLRCIQSARRFLPQSELILSTWPYDQNAGFDVDQEIINERPRPLLDDNGVINNFNLQKRTIVSGIEHATRPFILKLRNDSILTSSRIARVAQFTCSARARPPIRLFEAPITITNVFLRNPERFPTLFHLSDTVHFGTRCSLKTLWNQPDLTEEGLTINSRNRFRWRGNWLGYTSFREVPEQSLMLGLLRSMGFKVELSHPCDLQWDQFYIWERTLSDNFLVVNHQEAGIEFPARMYRRVYGLETVYTANEVDRLRDSSSSPIESRLRFERATSNATALAFIVKPRLLMSMVSNILYLISPRLGRGIRRIFYHLASLHRS